MNPHCSGRGEIPVKSGSPRLLPRHVPYAGDPCSMPTRVIDIHPHVIAADAKRYPRAPLGGHQSDWSRTRPVSTEQMIAARTRPASGRPPLVQASTCYGHDNSYVADAVAAHPDRFTGVFSVRHPGARCARDDAHWMGRGLTGHAALHHRQHHAGPGRWLDDPRSFPGLAQRSRSRLPVCLQMTAEAFPQLIVLLDASRACA